AQQKVTMMTLEEIDQLKQSGFGQPQPRHGLKLLYWFANDCLHLNQNNVMEARCYPNKGEFGFHTFENRKTKVGKLLPYAPLPYYVLGNLSYPKACNLPTYVRKDFNRCQDNSNMDRIMVSWYKNCFFDIYVTEHFDRSNFNKRFTFHISQHLIKIIRGLDLEEFLWKTGYLTQQTNFYPIRSVELSNQIPSGQDSLNKSESPHFRNENNIEEHDNTPPATSVCIPVATLSSNQDLHAEIESASNLKFGHHKASSSICSPASTPSMTQDVQMEVDSLLHVIKNNTEENNEASSTPSISSPAIAYSPNQDINAEFESPASFTNNNEPRFSTTGNNE
ncbi:vacuolar import and degradation protein 30-like, partial [Clarias magur]